MAKIRVSVGMSFEDELKILCEYAEVVENALSQIAKQRLTEISQTISEMSEEDVYLYDEDIDNARRQFTDVFPQVFRHSLFVSCYSLFENCFAQECNFYPKPSSIPQKPDGDKIRDIMKFLKKENEEIYKEEGQEFTGRFVDETQEWQRILIYSQLRNRIIHHSGQTPDDFLDKNKEIKKYIDQPHSQIDISEQSYILLSQNFIFEFAQTLRSFFKKLHNVRSQLYVGDQVLKKEQL